MDARTNEAATMILCDVLGKFAFAIADPAAPEEIAPTREDALRVEMHFNGVIRGTLGLLTTRELGLEVAANLLGLEPDDDEIGERAPDAIKELLNVVCGNLLTELAGDEEVFDLSIPALTEAESVDWSAWLAGSDTVCVTVDDRPLLLQLRIED